MDYGEDLAYWYLRLNGFFPLTNFVNHRLKEKDIKYPSDCDVLAVRPPHVFEDIGGKQDRWDANEIDVQCRGQKHQYDQHSEMQLGGPLNRYSPLQDHYVAAQQVQRNSHKKRHEDQALYRTNDERDRWE